MVNEENRSIMNQGKRKVVLLIVLCLLIAGLGVVFYKVAAADKDDILGYYVFDESLYKNPTISFIPEKNSMPYIYEIREDSLVITSTLDVYEERLPAEIMNAPVDENELLSKMHYAAEDPFLPPDLSLYNERWLYANFTGGAGQQYALYQMDSEIWLVQLINDGKLHGIYKLQKTR